MYVFSRLSLGSNFTVAVNSITGVLTVARSLDRETYPGFTIVIAATDQGPGYNQAIVRPNT